MSILLLASCNNAEPEETEASPTTGNAAAFEVEGTVRTVEVENEEPTPGATATEGPGTGSADANIRARLVIEVESMKAETMELCDVDEGDQITLTLTNQSAFDQDQEPDDLQDLEGRTVRAEGNAEELAAGDGTPGPDESASPAGSVSPEAGGGTMGANTTPEGASTQDPEAGCHFEVAKISVTEDEGDEGTGTSSPTPAPAGGGDVPGANATPGTSGTPTGQATPTATPGGTRIQG
jgi:hypothetical protein